MGNGQGQIPPCKWLLNLYPAHSAHCIVLHFSVLCCTLISGLQELSRLLLLFLGQLSFSFQDGTAHRTANSVSAGDGCNHQTGQMIPSARCPLSFSSRRPHNVPQEGANRCQCHGEQEKAAGEEQDFSPWLQEAEEFARQGPVTARSIPRLLPWGKIQQAEDSG